MATSHINPRPCQVMKCMVIIFVRDVCTFVCTSVRGKKYNCMMCDGDGDGRGDGCGDNHGDCDDGVVMVMVVVDVMVMMVVVMVMVVVMIMVSLPGS